MSKTLKTNNVGSAHDRYTTQLAYGAMNNRFTEISDVVTSSYKNLGPDFLMYKINNTMIMTKVYN